MSDMLNPYDTGHRAQPRVWTNMGDSLATLPPIEREFAEDRFGKVDFEDDESRTVATVWIEKGADGEHVVHIQQLGDEVKVKVHG